MCANPFFLIATCRSSFYMWMGPQLVVEYVIILYGTMFETVKVASAAAADF